MCSEDRKEPTCAERLDAARERLSFIDQHLFYLLAHPEDVQQVVRLLLFDVPVERDQYGHIVAPVVTMEP